MTPCAFKIGAMRFQRGNIAWHRDTLEFTLLAEDIEQNCWSWPGLFIAVEIDHIVKIVRSGPFSERPNFLAKGFFICIGSDMDAVFRHIAIGVIDREPHRGQGEMLVGRQIELDVGDVLAARGDRTAIGNLDILVIRELWKR